MKFLLAFVSSTASALALFVALLLTPSIAMSQTTAGPCDEQAICQAQKGALLLAQGLVEEAESLIPEGIRDGKTSSRAIGYSQALAQLDGELTREEAIAQTVQLTQRYARRQMSWFRRDERIHWLDYQDSEMRQKAISLIEANAPHLLGQ